MTEYNWDNMPIELRSKLLYIAGMGNTQATLKWSGFDADEKTKLTEALYGKTNGTATFSERS